MPHLRLKKYIWTREFRLLGPNRIALFEKCNICGKQRDYFVVESSSDLEWITIIK